MSDESQACEHEWEHLPPPLEGKCRCTKCGALGYRKRRPGHRGAKKEKVRLYKCRVKGCTNVVVERKFGSGWQHVNGCAEHPVR